MGANGGRAHQRRGPNLGIGKLNGKPRAFLLTPVPDDPATPPAT
jgi:hypothetical protein